MKTPFIIATALCAFVFPGCKSVESVKNSPLVPNSISVGTANNSEDGRIVGVTVMATYNLK